MSILTHVLDKLSSGRWILTVLGGVAFLYCVFTKQLEPATITAILMLIFQSYFQRTDRKENGNGDKRLDREHQA